MESTTIEVRFSEKESDGCEQLVADIETDLSFYLTADASDIKKMVFVVQAAISVAERLGLGPATFMDIVESMVRYNTLDDNN